MIENVLVGLIFLSFVLPPPVFSEETYRQTVEQHHLTDTY